jgi:hypothetical protein
MNMIRHIIEPKRLLLTWQASEEKQRRTRFMIAELTLTASDIKLHYLTESKDFKEACELGFAGHPAFPDIHKEYTSNVLAAFMHRLPPRTRSDFPKILESLCIPLEQGMQMSDFALLAYSGAKLPTDSFSIINPFTEAPCPCEFLTEIAGARYYLENIDQLHEGQAVQLVAEPDNIAGDALAICIMAAGKKLGYINRGQLAAFHHWLREQRTIEVNIEWLNDSGNRLSAYIFVKVS